MRTYMARLGDFTFGMDTAAFEQLQRSSTWRWQAKERIGRQPAMQITGRGSDSITLNGVIYPHFRGGIGQLGKLRDIGDTGKPQPLIYSFESTGQYCGLWCITDIEETRTVFFDNGAPRKIEFRLTLVEYGDDDGVFTFVPPVTAGASVAPSSTAVEKTASTVKSATKTVTNQSEALSMANRVASAAREVADTVSSNIKAITNSEAVRLAKSAIADIKSAEQSIKGLKTAVTQLSKASNPGAALTALSNLSSASDSMSRSLGSASKTLGATASSYGGSPTSSTFYKQEVESASSSLNTMASAGSSIKTSADTLKGFM